MCLLLGWFLCAVIAAEAILATDSISARNATTTRSLSFTDISRQNWPVLERRLLLSLQHNLLPPDTPIYIGNYAAAEPFILKGIQDLRAAGFVNAIHAPMFCINPSSDNKPYWGSRRAGMPGDPALAGPIPFLWNLSSAESFAWGTELGQRYRDEIIFLAETQDINISTWHFDEVVSRWGSDPGSAGPQITLLTSILNGLYNGRPERVDAPMPGILYVALWTTTLMPQFYSTMPEMPGLADAIAQSSLFWMLEDYESWHWDALPIGQQANGQINKIRKNCTRNNVGERLALKAGTANSPGYVKWQYMLQGQWFDNTTASPPGWIYLNLTSEEVFVWRDTYLRTHMAYSPAGYGQYNFLDQNGQEDVVNVLLKNYEAIFAIPQPPMPPLP